jgi:hypothetical protein
MIGDNVITYCDNSVMIGENVIIYCVMIGDNVITYFNNCAMIGDNVTTYCDNSVMIGEGDSGIHRSHVGGMDTTLSHLLNDRSQPLFQIVSTETI